MSGRDLVSLSHTHGCGLARLGAIDAPTTWKLFRRLCECSIETQGRDGFTAMSASDKYAFEQNIRYAGNLPLTITVRNRRVLLEGEPSFAECNFVDACANST